MPAFKNLQEYNKYLLTHVFPSVLQYVADKANELLRQHVDSDVYQAGNRTNYYAYGTTQPTFELRDSISNSDVQVSGDSAEIRVYHDKNKMRFEPDDFVHGSNYWRDGVSDVRDILPLIINNGLSGDLFGSGWWQEERPYFSNTIKEIQSQGLIKKWFQEGLAKQGIKTV